MRKMLFRGKRKDNGKWVKGDLIKSKDKCYIHPQANVFQVNNALSKFIVLHEVIPETVGQYTGLTDKNGKKIFEGDILRGYSYPYQDFEGNFNYYAEVVWFDDVPAFGMIRHSYPEAYRRLSEGDSDYFKNFESEDWEVICKIHKIIELLRGEEI